MVSRFQPASSAVEGRNGSLKQIHHKRRGLSSRRLQVMTILHNFYLKRADGTTAAQRLFAQPTPDLFEWLVQQMPDLPQARQRKVVTKPKNLALSTVPA
jgi:succinate dehydrogenase flavin-adding protein (antitoxin of CptAB toxin-antitoxin module)